LNNKRKWSKELVQEHAKAAVSVELYTLPIYITALASIKDKASESYALIRSVMMEEMLHLELSANLCLALDTTPSFTAPIYGVNIPYIKSFDPVTGDRRFLKATLGSLNKITLNTMLDIESPESGQSKQKIDHTNPQYPYNSIGEMYEAIIFGIRYVGEDKFSWSTVNQQMYWSKSGTNEELYPQIIRNYNDAKDAIGTIIEQGEGKQISPFPSSPYKKENFPVANKYQLIGESNDSSPYAAFSHFGRFVQLKNNGLPEVYEGTQRPDATTNKILQQNFAMLLNDLNTTWNTGEKNIWSMTSLLSNAQDCWRDGVIPKWS
jgi:hypothetical protein